MTTKWDIESVKEFYKSKGCEFLAEEFGTVETSYPYRCHCGEISKTSFRNFRTRRKGWCSKCRYIDTMCGSKRKYTIEEVRKLFKERGCELLADRYVNSKTKLKYRCSCGEVGFIKLNNLLNGRKCRKCGIAKISGEKNPNYSPNLTDEDRQRSRWTKGYKYFKRKVLHRDDYCCQKCGDKTQDLHVHHIFSYKNYPEKRVDVDNGITLCQRCHIEYHREFKEVNDETFNTYISKPIKQPPRIQEEIH